MTCSAWRVNAVMHGRTASAPTTPDSGCPDDATPPAPPRPPLAVAAALSGPAWAQTAEAPAAATDAVPAATSSLPFVVSDIRVDGLQRIGAGTVFTYLPVERGDTLDSAKAAQAIRALYKTGFFEDVRLARQGDILVVTVSERPAINKLTITGNKDIKTDDLTKGLKDIGLSEGDTFSQQSLDTVTQEPDPPVQQPRQVQRRDHPDHRPPRPQPRRHHHRDQGRQGGEDPPHQPGRQREVRAEGHPRQLGIARIQLAQLVPPRRPVFAREAVRRPREAQRVLPRPRLHRFQHRQHPGRDEPGQARHVHHRGAHRGRVVQDFRSSSRGYRPAAGRNAEWCSEGRPDVLAQAAGSHQRRDHQHPVQHRLRLRPGEPGAAGRSRQAHRGDRPAGGAGAAGERPPHPVQGNNRTADEVMRREMRQFENAWYSQAAIDCSKGAPAAPRLLRQGRGRDPARRRRARPGRRRLQRHRDQFRQLHLRPRLLAAVRPDHVGAADRKQLPRHRQPGIGRGQPQRLPAALPFSFTNPYFTDEGLSLGYNLWWREFDNSNFNTASYSTTSAAAQMVAGLPITENDTVSGLFGIDRNVIYAYPGSSPQGVRRHIDALGTRTFHARARNWAGRAIRATTISPRPPACTSACRQVTLPGSTVQYYKLNYQFSVVLAAIALRCACRTRARRTGRISRSPITTRSALCRAATSTPTTNSARPRGLPRAAAAAERQNRETTSSDYIKTVTAEGRTFGFYAGGTNPSDRSSARTRRRHRQQPAAAPRRRGFLTVGSMVRSSPPC